MEDKPFLIMMRIMILAIVLLISNEIRSQDLTKGSRMRICVKGT